jgi:hypothetical protein
MGGIAPGRFIDPVNITGLADQTAPRRVGSTVSGAGVNGSGTADDYWAAEAAKGAAPHMPAPQKGFWESTVPSGDNALWALHPGLIPMPPPPPSHWSYDPTKGASWATPQRKGSSTEYEYVSNAPGSAEYNSFKGNRI